MMSKPGTVVQAIETFTSTFETYITKGSIYVVQKEGMVQIHYIIDDNGRIAAFHRDRFKIILSP